MDSLAVGFDVTPLLGQQTGIGRSVAEVRQALEELPDGPRLVPYAFGRPAHRPALPEGSQLVPLPTRVLLSAWARSEHPRLDRWVRGATVVHATAFVAAPTTLPTVVTVHDCGFALHPSGAAPFVASFGPLLQRAVDRGAHVHTTTEQVGREVQEVLGLDLGDRLHVVPFAIPDLPEADPDPSLPPYLLSVGTQDERKNLANLVRAFALLEGDLRLVLAGAPGSGTVALQEALEELPRAVRERVDLHGRVDEETRAALVAGAQVLAYPSLYEGFGFPVLEGMSRGVPVLASDIPVLREVGGTAAVYADPTSPEALAEGLREALRGERVEQGRTRAAEFTWERTARGLLEVYRALSSR